MKVTLTASHTHAGTPHVAGDVIDVSAPVADWLIRHRRGMRAYATPSTSTHDTHRTRRRKARGNTEDTHHGE